MAKPAASSSRMWISLDLTSASETSGVAQTSREMRRIGSRSAATAAAARAAEGGGPGRGSGTVSRSGRRRGRAPRSGRGRWPGHRWPRRLRHRGRRGRICEGRPRAILLHGQTTLAAARPAGNLRAQADVRAVAVDLEPVGGVDEVAELGLAEGAGVELGGKVLHAAGRRCRAGTSPRHPPRSAPSPCRSARPPRPSGGAALRRRRLAPSRRSSR